MLGEPLRRPASPLGTDSEAVLQECGLAPERIAALRRNEVV
jgi:crotonobetainyl-CoA:carnitine CoA-transferase CaiB-like acyl-CoA transferase